MREHGLTKCETDRLIQKMRKPSSTAQGSMVELPGIPTIEAKPHLWDSRICHFILPVERSVEPIADADGIIDEVGLGGTVIIYWEPQNIAPTALPGTKQLTHCKFAGAV